jgi:hypothetical protein
MGRQEAPDIQMDTLQIDQGEAAIAPDMPDALDQPTMLQRIGNIASVSGAGDFMRSRRLATWAVGLGLGAAGGVAIGGAYETGDVASAATQPGVSAATTTRVHNQFTPWKKCLPRYNKNNADSWVCAKIKGPHTAQAGEKTTYTFTFGARHTLKGVKLCVGGNFQEVNKRGCLWQHNYRTFKKGRKVTKTLTGTPVFRQDGGGANVGILATSRKPSNGWRAIGVLEQQATAAP